MADEWIAEPSAKQRTTPSAVIGARSTSVRGSEFRQFSVEQQQAALGAGHPEADTGNLRER
jgi:hypothetical protein